MSGEHAVNVNNPQEMLKGITLADLAKPNHKTCHGRGYVGTWSKSKDLILCNCVKRNYNRIRQAALEYNRQLAAAQQEAYVALPWWRKLLLKAQDLIKKFIQKMKKGK